MIRAHPTRGAVAAIAALALLGACDGGVIPGSGSGAGAPIDIQLIHQSGVILQVRSVQRSDERALVNIHVLNGRDREVELASGSQDSYILTDNGEKLMLAKGTSNPDLAVPPGKSMDGALVFAGKLPSSGKVTLILNGNGSRDNAHTSTPRFEVVLPLDGAGNDAVPEASALSNMISLPESKIGLARDAGGTFGPGGGTATSSLQAVEKLKTELGATETERGTVVSLPGDITFDFNKATIRTEGHATLDRLVQLITAGGEGEITIEGHTDAKGDDDYNKRLSEQRADAVKAYLAEKGIAADRMKTIGLGELRPVAPNAKPDGTDDEDGRQRNRRVEVILPKGNASPATETGGE